ncbi:MAG: phytanoyl-CoA dioxygenase family protein [Chloroflexota bacterium]
MQKIVRGQPLLINKNLGSAELTTAAQLTSTNADGLPVIPPTVKQMYDFDRNGWLLIPGVLSGDELAEIQAYCERLIHAPGRIPNLDTGKGAASMSGPLEKLMDHPIIVGFLNEFLAYAPCASEDSYGFRMETSMLFHRSVKHQQRPFSPHNGNGLLRPPWDSHYYRCVPGKVWSGLTRVVWELNPVKYRQGGTLFISGSHKAAYPVPESARLDEQSPIWESYSCPAGSVIIFTESTSHSSATWTDAETDRLAIFNLYNAVAHRWYDWLPDADTLAQMHPKRQSLFRDVHVVNNVETGQFHERVSPFEEA